MSQQSTRRDFLKTTGAASAAWWIGTQASYGLERSPIERINFACIGVEGKGSSDTDSAAGQGNIVALCDIDDNRLRKKAARFPNAKKYHDYRQMLEELGDEIDAVTVSTPDHSHAPASVMAMKMGKHCFCQKPLTWSLYEARVMREVAAKNDLATQMGNQGTAQSALRNAVDIVKAGIIGDVKEVHVWTNRPIWAQGTGRPSDTPATPKNVHWDLFLGPAPERPYHPAYHPFKWRGWVDFGTGALGDMACHTMNMPVMALDLFNATSVVAESPGIYEGETYPKFSTIHYEFPERQDSRTGKTLPAANLTWYDGGKKPSEELLLGQAKLNTRGSILVGSKATLYSDDDYCGRFTVFTKDGKFEYEQPTDGLPKSPGHFVEFANAIKSGNKDKAMSNFDYAGRLTETVLLGNLALHADKKVEWDAENLKATNAPELASVIKRDYRKGWTL